MDPCPGAYNHVHRSNRQKGRPQVRGSSSRVLQPRAQVEQAVKGGHRHVDPRQGDVHRSNRQKKAATSTWIYVHGHTASCTGRTGGKGWPQARGSSSRGLQPPAQVEHAKNGSHRYVDPRPGAYSHVHRSNRRKSAATGTWIHVHGATATCTGRTG